MATLVERLGEQPAGTTIRLPEGRWAVRGKSEWHVVEPERPACSCADFQFRRSARGAICKHLRLVMDRIAAERQAAAALPSQAALKEMFR